MKCSVGVKCVLVVSGFVRRDWKARGFPGAKSAGDVCHIREAFGLEQARGDRRARAALSVLGDRCVPRNVLRELRKVAEKKMTRSGHVAGVPFGLAANVDHETVVIG
jgi:hypothetical protein